MIWYNNDQIYHCQHIQTTPLSLESLNNTPNVNNPLHLVSDSTFLSNYFTSQTNNCKWQWRYDVVNNNIVFWNFILIQTKPLLSLSHCYIYDANNLFHSPTNLTFWHIYLTSQTNQCDWKWTYNVQHQNIIFLSCISMQTTQLTSPSYFYITGTNNPFYSPTNSTFWCIYFISQTYQCEW